MAAVATVAAVARYFGRPGNHGSPHLPFSKETALNISLISLTSTFMRQSIVPGKNYLALAP